MIVKLCVNGIFKDDINVTTLPRIGDTVNIKSFNEFGRVVNDLYKVKKVEHTILCFEADNPQKYYASDNIIVNVEKG